MSNQISDYLETQIKNGHSEQTLRSHLMAHGWSEAAVNDAFARHRASNAPAVHIPELKQAKKHRTRTLRKYKMRKVPLWGKLAVALVVLGLVGGAGYNTVQKSMQKPPAPTVVPELSYEQKQAFDANTIAGGIVQYVTSTEGVLPTRTTTTPEGSVVLCNNICDSLNASIGSLIVYKPTGLKFAAYASDLTVTDKEQLLMVPHAKCASRTTIGEPNPNPRSMVVLYATASSQGLSQHCITL